MLRIQPLPPTAAWTTSGRVGHHPVGRAFAGRGRSRGNSTPSPRSKRNGFTGPRHPQGMNRTRPRDERAQDVRLAGEGRMLGEGRVRRGFNPICVLEACPRCFGFDLELLSPELNRLFAPRCVRGRRGFGRQWRPVIELAKLGTHRNVASNIASFTNSTRILCRLRSV